MLGDLYLQGETMGNVPLYNANEGVHGRAPGVYLDEVQNAAAERVRAVVEGRDPESIPSASYSGIPLRRKELLTSNTYQGAPLGSGEHAPVSRTSVDAPDDPELLDQEADDALSGIDGPSATEISGAATPTTT